VQDFPNFTSPNHDAAWQVKAHLELNAAVKLILFVKQKSVRGLCVPHCLQVSPGASLQRQLGNLYTASLYSSLASLLAQEGQGLQGKRLLCFSFGSGVVASMFTLTARASGNGSSSAGSCTGVCDGSRQCEQQAEAMQQQQQQQQQGKSWESVPCLQGMADQVGVPLR